MRSSGLIKRNFRYPKDVRIAEINGKSKLICLELVSRCGGTFLFVSHVTQINGV